MELNQYQSEKITEEITEYIFTPFNKFKTTIFLCGGTYDGNDNIRQIIGDELKKIRRSNIYDIIYPEELFNEILYGNKKADLLSLENLLAESVDAIVIIPESPGSFSELGAFSNNKKLLKKIICIVDEKYKLKKSFIIQGPVKLVKKQGKNRVIFFNKSEVSKTVENLKTALNKIKTNSNKNIDKVNLLQLDNFLLFSIFVLEPIQRTPLIKLLSYTTNDENISYPITVSLLSTLMKKNFVVLTSEGYKLSSLGINEVYDFLKVKTRSRNSELKNNLDNLRLKILNSKLRNKKLNF